MIELLPYTQKWKHNFEQIKKLLLSKSNNLFIKISHIGSTSIEEAPAKDIVDIQCAVDSFDSIGEIKMILEPLGFIYIEEFKQDHVPFYSHEYFDPSWEKRFFTGHYLNQAYNIHIRRHNSLNWQFAEQFRDYLKTNREARYAFMQFKERLASSHIEKETYAMVKDSVIDLLSLQFFKPNESYK